MKSIALVLEFGGRFAERDTSHFLAITAERQVTGPSYRAVLRAAAAALLALSVTAAVLVAPPDYEALGNYGYLGVFAVTLITTASFVLPVPYLAVIFKAGTFLNPLAIAAVAGLAASLGELTGYLVGLGARNLMGGGRLQRLSEHWMERHGFLTISIAAFIPNPAFDAAGIAAGALRYPVWKFAAACFLGKSAKFLLIAAFGTQF